MCRAGRVGGLGSRFGFRGAVRGSDELLVANLLGLPGLSQGVATLAVDEMQLLRIPTVHVGVLGEPVLTGGALHEVAERLHFGELHNSVGGDF